MEILKAAEAEHCDLIALAGHGHRLFGDIFHGSTVTRVRHRTQLPPAHRARQRGSLKRSHFRLNFARLVLASCFRIAPCFRIITWI